MPLTKKEIDNIIKQEIDWHTNNYDKANMPREWKDGFIEGLKQLKVVFKNLIYD